jgi:hypothetical protein
MNKEDEKSFNEILEICKAKGIDPVGALITAGKNGTADWDMVKKLQDIADREFARLILEKETKK